MTQNLEDQIRLTWHKNAECWTKAVRQQTIESRRLITDDAVVQAVLQYHPNTVLDLGCGEGWLTRALTRQGIKVLGVDTVDTLIRQAQDLGEGTFRQMDYQNIANGALEESFDVVVCNFSLFGKDSVNQLVQRLPTLLNPKGHLVIQTLHPKTVLSESNDIDGWREGSWDGFSSDFTDPAPWYFRTTESWLDLLEQSRFQLDQIKSPQHPQTDQAVSLILTAMVLIPHYEEHSERTLD